MTRIFTSALAIGVFVAAMGAPAWAAPVSLIDSNSVADFSTNTQAGAFSWTVDGIQQLSQQWFWYRIGNTAEQSIDTLPILSQALSDATGDGFNDTLFTKYNGAGFTLSLKYSLQGGSVGSGASDLGEQISIHNSSGHSLDFHFFQYSNFELNGTPANQTAVFTNNNQVEQVRVGGTGTLSETVITPVPTHREIAFFPATLNALNDGSPTTLTDTPIGTVIGPGNVTWAYQWDVTIANNATFQISKDKALSFVPEPSALLMAGMGLLGLVSFVARRRHKA
jgi:PEP-CTERM motif